jgi:hypothetical protein
MRIPDEVLDQVRTRYNNNWRDWLVLPPGKLSFSLSPPSAHAIAHDSVAVRTWLRIWRAWADDHPVAHLRTVSRRTLIGNQQIYTHMDLFSVESLASLDTQLAERWHTAKQRYAVLAEFAVPQDRLKPYLTQITDLDNYDFDLLIRVARWFTENPRSGLTMRQVPVLGMHTKWLARHRTLVLSLLHLRTERSTLLNEPDDDSLDAHDLDILGLRPLPNNVDIILIDPKDQRSLGGLRHVRAPLEEIAELPLYPRHVLIIENKQSALPVPNWPGVVVVHSLGNYLDALAAVPWIADAKTWYWGDLDHAGFTLLSRARARLPGITSVLMDRDTLSRYVAFAVKDTTGRIDPPDPTLTTAERETLEALATEGHRLRLEQERIPWRYVVRVLEETLEMTHSCSG